jgi:SdpC family antimicrobial peptide
MKKKLSIFILLAMLSFGVFQSCSDTEDTKPLAQYSGEELFRAVFFLQGEATNHLQSLKPNVDQMSPAPADEKIKKSNEAFANEIIAKINELDPKYFDNFKQQLESDNYYSIELALTNGTKMVRAAGYRSTYAGLFKLMDDIRDKNVNFESDAFKNLDLSKAEDVEKFKQHMKSEYAIDLDDEDYMSACTPGLAVCWYIAAVVHNALAVFFAAAVQSVVAINVAYVYNLGEWWGGTGMTGIAGQTDVLIQELAQLL